MKIDNSNKYEISKPMMYFLGLCFLFFALVILMTLFGNLTFGNGLGDLFTLMVVFVWLISIGWFYHYLKRGKAL